MAEWTRAAGRVLRAEWPALAWAALIFYLSGKSHPLPVEIPIRHVDKLLHAGAYALLSGLTVRGLLAAGLAGRRAILIAIVAASVYGISDEWHQSFTPGRDADPLDWAADSAGAIAGAVIAAGLPRRRSRASIRG